jgi:hypothetical protein
VSERNYYCREAGYGNRQRHVGDHVPRRCPKGDSIELYLSASCNQREGNDPAELRGKSHKGIKCRLLGSLMCFVEPHSPLMSRTRAASS